jgi:hypothetical protein
LEVQVTSEASVVVATATGDEIGAIAAKIMPAIDGENQSHTIMALLGIAMMLMYPAVTDDQLSQSVDDISRYMCLLIDGYANPSSLEEGLKAN